MCWASTLVIDVVQARHDVGNHDIRMKAAFCMRHIRGPFAHLKSKAGQLPRKACITPSCLLSSFQLTAETGSAIGDLTYIGSSAPTACSLGGFIKVLNSMDLTSIFCIQDKNTHEDC